MLEGYAKLKLNSVFGLYNSVYSPLYMPTLAYATTINGQLLLAMLAERLLMHGFDVIGANTDAVNVHVPNDRWEEYLTLCGKWEKLTKMGLDHDEFDVIYEKGCNDYIAKYTNGAVKTKGLFVTELDMLKGYKYPVVKEVLVRHFTEDIPVEKALREHDDIYDFCMTTKMGFSKKFKASFEAYHNSEKLQKTNRYFASTNGAYLFKSPDNGITLNHVLKDSGVTIFNQYVKKDMKDYKINYPFYLREVNKIVEAINDKQLTLF